MPSYGNPDCCLCTSMTRGTWLCPRHQRESGERANDYVDVSRAFKAMRDAELKIDDMDILTESEAYRAAMAAAENYHRVLERYEAKHGRLK